MSDVGKLKPQLQDTVQQLHNILKTSPILESISMFENHEPLVLESYHLGISRKSFKQLGLYARDQFVKISREKDLSEKETQLEELSVVLILLNPDDSKYWNFRKNLFKKYHINNEEKLSAELRLSSHPLKLKPKSAEPFNHCRWLLANNSNVLNQQIIAGQLRMCEDSSESYKYNYYSWTYRSWLISNFPTFVTLREELEWSRRWVESHISQFCGMNYRFNLLLISLKNHHGEDENIKDCWTQSIISEILFVCDLVLFYPESESLWAYLRLVVMYCAANKTDYVKECSQRLACLEKVKGKFAERFKERVLLQKVSCKDH
jgi:hypothetical protein